MLRLTHTESINVTGADLTHPDSWVLHGAKDLITFDEREGNFRRESVEGRRNDASQPYRFGSRSLPRRSFSFDFAELVSPHTHTLRGLSAHPYIESGNRFSVLMYRPRVPQGGWCSERNWRARRDL